jgi:hypothetical protein
VEEVILMMMEVEVMKLVMVLEVEILPWRILERKRRAMEVRLE